MTNVELLAIGGAYIDINCDNFPFDDKGLVPEAEVVGNGYEMVPGGSAVNFARLCSALGVPTVFVGKTGDDALGAMLARLLNQAGVQPELIVDKAASTNLGFGMTNEAGQTISAVVGNANKSLTPEEVYERASKVLVRCSHLYAGGCFRLKSLLPALEHLVARAKETSTLTILDHGRINNGVTNEAKETMRQLALQVDYYLPSKDEFQELWGVSSIEEGLRLLAAKTQTIVVVKDGSRGAVVLVDDQVVCVPAFEVRPIHMVGAGDSFNAGFIASQSRGEDLRTSVRFGCATAALKISQVELPTNNQVEHLLAM